jgi:hypothetical protein
MTSDGSVDLQSVMIFTLPSYGSLRIEHKAAGTDRISLLRGNFSRQRNVMSFFCLWNVSFFYRMNECEIDMYLSVSSELWRIDPRLRILGPIPASNDLCLTGVVGCPRKRPDIRFRSSMYFSPAPTTASSQSSL